LGKEGVSTKIGRNTLAVEEGCISSGKLFLKGVEVRDDPRSVSQVEFVVEGCIPGNHSEYLGLKGGYLGFIGGLERKLDPRRIPIDSSNAGSEERDKTSSLVTQKSWPSVFVEESLGG